MKTAAFFLMASFFAVSGHAETETINSYDYGTNSFSTTTINRDRNGTVQADTYDYGTNSFKTYQGDQNGGTEYDYGTNSFKTFQGNPYGRGE